MCCDLATPCALRASAKPLATTPSTHAMPWPLRGGSKGQNLRARPEHPPLHALWGGLGSGSNCNRSTRAPSTHHVKGGQGSRVKLSPCLIPSGVTRVTEYLIYILSYKLIEEFEMVCGTDVSSYRNSNNSRQVGVYILLAAEFLQQIGTHV